LPDAADLLEARIGNARGRFWIATWAFQERGCNGGCGQQTRMLAAVDQGRA
jgi:hypothetical protein